MKASASIDALTNKQQALLRALLAGKSTEQGAKDAGISDSTAYRWVKQSAFKEALRQGQQELFMQHLGILRTGIKTALATLARNMSDITPPATQVQAARIWLEQAVTLYKVDEEVGAFTNVVLSPEWVTLRAKLLTTLADYPEAKLAVIAALSQQQDEGSNGHRE